nr:lantibiotic dehydratase C-terminal domain-containing protein [Pedobacter glucosidilyticus]
MKIEIGAIRSLAQTINSLDYLNFICDFFHLHVNRLFARNQKEKEALCYHCLQKWMKAKIALAKQGIT